MRMRDEPRTLQNDAIRSDKQIAQRLYHDYGATISAQRVRQIRLRAERKIARALWQSIINA